MYLVDRTRCRQSSLNIPMPSLCQISLDSFSISIWSDSKHRKPKNNARPTTCVAEENGIFPRSLRKCISCIHKYEDLRYSGNIYWSKNKGLPSNTPNPISHPWPGSLALSFCKRSPASGATGPHLGLPSPGVGLGSRGVVTLLDIWGSSSLS